jgi:hypothetical protein
MKQETKVTLVLYGAVAIMVAIVALLAYGMYCDITNPQPKPQHGSYAHCEYRTVKGACGKWTTKTY